jgi:hypothetical protein
MFKETILGGAAALALASAAAAAPQILAPPAPTLDIVFKDSVGYDAPKLLESVKGRYGQY